VEEVKEQMIIRPLLVGEWRLEASVAKYRLHATQQYTGLSLILHVGLLGYIGHVAHTLMAM